MSGQLYVWMMPMNSCKTLAYITVIAESIEDARAKVLAKVDEVNATTTECKFKGEDGVEYSCSTSTLGSKDGVLHLSGTECLTTEEFCKERKFIEEELAKEPLHIAPATSVGFCLSNFNM
jgi:hypothetical protein